MTNEQRKILKEKAISLRLCGLIYKEIGLKLNVSENSIMKWTRHIKLTDTQIDKINSKDNIYKYKVSVFTVPTELTYYLLGVVASDGCVDKNLRQTVICSKDEDWLQSISREVCSNKSLYKRKTTDCYDLRISNKFITKWFYKNGCVPNKSLTLKFPLIEKKYLSHFLRGMFDGDGCVIVSKRKGLNSHAIQAYIVSSSKDFVDVLSSTCNALQIKNSIAKIKEVLGKTIKGNVVKTTNDCWRVYFRGSAAVKFLTFIYKGKSICLDRKYDKFQNYLKIREWEKENLNLKIDLGNLDLIVDLLKTKDYSEVANMYNTCPRTIINKLLKANLFKPNRSY